MLPYFFGDERASKLISDIKVHFDGRYLVFKNRTRTASQVKYRWSRLKTYEQDFITRFEFGLALIHRCIYTKLSLAISWDKLSIWDRLAKIQYKILDKYKNKRRCKNEKPVHTLYIYIYIIFKFSSKCYTPNTALLWLWKLLKFEWIHILNSYIEFWVYITFIHNFVLLKGLCCVYSGHPWVLKRKRRKWIGKFTLHRIAGRVRIWLQSDKDSNKGNEGLRELRNGIPSAL